MSLLAVGGLTVDRFSDGREAPGGSVLHSGLAAVAEGASLTVLTTAGDEPAARDGLERLRVLGDLVHQPATATTTYRHEEARGRRVLVYEAAGQAITTATATRVGHTEVAVLAPIADELPMATVDAIRRELRPRLVVALIQGWLRRLEIGSPVRPLPLDEVPAEVWQRFGEADAIVVSTEDLAEAPDDPFAQATRLRQRLGPRPLLVLTLGVRGYLLDDPAADRMVAAVPRTVVEGVPAVGAGDTFGAALAVRLARGEEPIVAADAATECVIRVLEARR